MEGMPYGVNRTKTHAAKSEASKSMAAAAQVEEEKKEEAQIDEDRVVDKAVARMISDTVKDSEFI